MSIFNISKYRIIVKGDTKEYYIKTIDKKNVCPCVVGCNNDVYLDKQIKYTIKNVKNIKIDTLNKHQHINIDTNETYTLYEYTITFVIY